MGIAREEHEILMRPIDMPGGRLSFCYAYWGALSDPSAVSCCLAGGAWKPAASSVTQQLSDQWSSHVWDLGVWGSGSFRLRLVFPPTSISRSTPCFYDAFQLLCDGKEIWRGDAGENWQRWYTTGFSIFKRAEHAAYAGVALHAEGRRGVHLRAVRATGFLTALSLRDCTRWTVEGNDFSDNYHDPEYGWGEGDERNGAMFLEGVTDSVIRGNRAHRVWNGLSLRRCARLLIERNDISHCSNTCLKMAQSSDNRVIRNIFSWGIRISPGEVHARDSVSLLVESGSDNNVFIRNDFSHGGDGIFIRVLNHWCSTGNLFYGNDCSYANNNAVESWSPGNRYVRNKANWSSYGFWLGGSDDTVLVGNEVCHNGLHFRNAPMHFGNAGISVVHGPSTGFVLADNRIESNAGPGVALAYKPAVPARGWLIVDNRINRNSNDERGYAGHGLFLEHCDGVIIQGNDLHGNEGSPLAIGEASARVACDGSSARYRDGLRIMTPSPVVAGCQTTLRVEGHGSGAALYRWDFGDGTNAVSNQPSIAHTFAAPGALRAVATVLGSGKAWLATRVIPVIPRGTTIAPCDTAEGWGLLPADRGSLGCDRRSFAEGEGALVISARAAMGLSLVRHLAAPADLSSSTGVCFFYRYACELFVHTGKCNRIIGLRLHSGSAGAFHVRRRWSAERAPSEERYDWAFFTAAWTEMEREGSPELSRITDLEILFGPEEPADLVFRLGALMSISP